MAESLRSEKESRIDMEVVIKLLKKFLISEARSCSMDFGGITPLYVYRMWDGQVVALNVPEGQWHTVKALESGTVILEMKDGPYEPTGAEDILK